MWVCDYAGGRSLHAGTNAEARPRSAGTASQCACSLMRWLDDDNTHTRLTALCPGLPGWASTRKVKPVWILLKQETVSGSGISWAICNSAPRCRQTTMPAPQHSLFKGRMPFLPPNWQCQSTEGHNSGTVDSAVQCHLTTRQFCKVYSSLFFL